jgi:hypothetical protein
MLGNSAGGYYINNGHSTITRSTIARNSGRDGAGIHVSYGGTVHVVQSTITGNMASGAGGGIFTQDDPFGRNGADIDLVNSTVTANSAETGGGIAIDNESEGFRVALTNTTVTSNSGRVEGGGIVGPGYDGPSVFLRNSIVALNTAPSSPDLLGEFDAGFNLIGNAAGSNVTNADGNRVGVNPKLGSLSLNGGPTRTIPLLAGSPAIDAGTSDRCPPEDQRGVSRPQGGGCDMGSYERQQP